MLGRIRLREATYRLQDAISFLVLVDVCAEHHRVNSGNCCNYQKHYTSRHASLDREERY